MENIRYIGKETIEVHLKPNSCIDHIEYGNIKGYKKNLLFCMLDRNNNQCLIYDYSGFISLSKYMSINKFNLLEYYRLLLKLAKTINSFENSTFDKNCIILNYQYIYVNPNTKEFSFIVIPVRNIGSFEDGYRQLFRDLSQKLIASPNVSEHIFKLIKLSETKFQLGDFINYLTYKSSMKPKMLKSNFIILAICNFIIMGLGSISYIYFLKGNGSLVDILVLVSLCVLSLLVSGGINLIMTKKKLKNIMINSELSIQLNETSTQSEVVQNNNEQVFVQEQTMSSIQNNSSNKSRVNSTSTNKIQSIRTGVLNTDSHYQESEQRAISPLESQPTGVLLDAVESAPYLTKKSNKSEKFELNKYKVIIGREAGSVDICLTESSVSKIHAVITEKNGVYYLCDQNSSNGTYLNNQRLNKMEEYRLNANDLIRFSNQEYIFNK